MTSRIDFQSEIETLPPDLQKEVWEFVQFVKRRHGLPSERPEPSSAATTSDSALFQALDEIGFVGCIESDEQLSKTYKTKVDFSKKYGKYHDFG
ncbi:conserved hypothetical protein [Desulfonatronospira thiodismutans ASO3-1]|uniref:DUF2281 domain-containing protein n=1 Tax=Desulfonatronospira thiodismutans ASO3-1 TaxID=555779 RepID=D6STC8_9BACT|nr:conserved hypothetical protein [Desulfonatronospira thiodismutans ASO3-1]